jgi:ribosomal protein S18 acetylase RimI-like enzyme
MPTPFKFITASTPADYDNFKTLLQTYYAETDPETQKVSSILKDSANLPGRYAPPRGGIVLAYQGAELAGCGALSATAHSGLAEIKRVYVLNTFRRQGLARQLTLVCMELARQACYHAVGVGALPHNTPAIALYQQLGFKPVSNFRDTSAEHLIFLGVGV